MRVLARGGTEYFFHPLQKVIRGCFRCDDIHMSVRVHPQDIVEMFVCVAERVAHDNNVFRLFYPVGRLAPQADVTMGQNWLEAQGWDQCGDDMALLSYVLTVDIDVGCNLVTDECCWVTSQDSLNR